MGKIIETTINKFNGGMVFDPRDPREDTCRVVSNFDILTSPNKLIPYRDSENAYTDGGSAALKPQNFAVAIRTGTTYKLFWLGVQTGAADAQIIFTDLDGSDLTTPTNNEQGTGTTTDFNLFIYYKKTGRIYGARDSTHIWAFDPSSAAVFNDTERAIAYTNMRQGMVHSKDDILYIPYDNKIAKNDNGVWVDEALVLPNFWQINSICEYGNYIAIGCASASGVGGSRIFLWDRNSSLVTVSESIDWGTGNLRVLDEIDGFLVGVSVHAGTEEKFTNRDLVTFKYYSPAGMVKFAEFLGNIGAVGNSFPLAKQKINDRLYFMLSIQLGIQNEGVESAYRAGVWSVGKVGDQFVVIHERTPINDTAITGGGLRSFIKVGDFLFIAFVNAGGSNAIYRTNDTKSFTATAIYESKFFAGDASKKKDLVGFSIMTEYLTGSGQVVCKYRIDNETSFTTFLTHSTANAISASVSSGATLPKAYKEIQFRLESTNSAEITGFSFKESILESRPY